MKSLSCLNCLECDKFKIGFFTYENPNDNINEDIDEKSVPSAAVNVNVEITEDNNKSLPDDEPSIDDVVLKKDVWVLAKFEGPKKNVMPYRYVCWIIKNLIVQGYQKYEKSSKQEFVMCKNDICDIEKKDIEILPEPQLHKINRKIVFIFPTPIDVEEMSS